MRANLVVEGVSEETFVRDLLSLYLGKSNVFVVARSVETSRHKLRSPGMAQRNAIYRGGIPSYEKAKRDIERWLKQDTTAFVSTMFDLYALPTDFPGYAPRPPGNGVVWAEAIESAMRGDIKDSRFIPYVQVHEFEALLFSEPSKFDEIVPDSRISRDLQTIRDAFPTPEDIDGGAESAPSKRILNLYQAYKKVLNGTRVARAIGMPRITQECRHFRGWVEKLESLASGSSPPANL